MRVLVYVLALLLQRVFAEHCMEGGVFNTQFNKCYYFVPSPLSYVQAQQVCFSLNARLVTIQEDMEIMVVFSESNKKFAKDDFYWIGLSQFENCGSWVWSDFTSIDYTEMTFWNDGYPLENCSLACASGSVSKLYWSNVPCETSRLKFVCETDAAEDDYFEECPESGLYNSAQGKCYYVINSPQVYGDAQQTCTGLGGFLVNINSEAERDLVIRFVKKKKLKGDAYWIGLSEDANGTWKWSNSYNITYTNWQSTDQPYRDDIYKCAVAENDRSFNSKQEDRWYSTLCDTYLHGFVCEIAAPVLTPPPLPFSTISPSEGSWIYFSLTDSWYLIYNHNSPTWRECETACQKFGGHLTSVHSIEENRFIVELFAGAGAYAWIGFVSPEFQPYQFMWTDLTAVDFTNWEQGRPVDDKYCIALESNGRWFNNNCTQGFANYVGICKRPNSA